MPEISYYWEVSNNSPIYQFSEFDFNNEIHNQPHEPVKSHTKYQSEYIYNLTKEGILWM